MKHTVGEYKVGVTFNPSQNEMVDEIKRRAADLIDYINAIPVAGIPERGRLKAMAMTDVETAAMHAVKAATKPEQT